MSDVKRGVILGLCTAVFVGALILIVSFQEASAGCTGDCMTCHPKLKNDKRHQSMKTCIKCHDPNKKSFSITSSNKGDGCGDKCFDCHKDWPKDGYHADLPECIRCHVEKDKKGKKK